VIVILEESIDFILVDRHIHAAPLYNESVEQIVDVDVNVKRDTFE